MPNFTSGCSGASETLATVAARLFWPSVAKSAAEPPSRAPLRRKSRRSREAGLNGFEAGGVWRGIFMGEVDFVGGGRVIEISTEKLGGKIG